MSRRLVNARGVLDPDDRVHRGVADKQGAPKARDRPVHTSGLEVFEELPPDAEPATPECDDGLPCGPDLALHRGEEVYDVAGIVRRADGYERPHGVEPPRSLQHGRAAEGVPDQDAGCLMCPLEERTRGDQIFHVGTEARIGEVAFAFAQAGEIEPQHRDPVPVELLADVDGCLDVLRAGEAVSEEGGGKRRAVRWQVELGHQCRAHGPVEG